MFPALASLSGGGGLSLSSQSDAKQGPITVGGLTFAPKGSRDSMIVAGAVALIALGALAYLTKG